MKSGPLNLRSNQAGDTLRLPIPGCESPLDLSWCPPGGLAIGSGDMRSQSPAIPKCQRRVDLTAGFWIARTPITRFQWIAIAGAKPRLGGYAGTSDLRPAEGMAWLDAVTFCERLTTVWRELAVLPDGAEARLPSEAEWEYACRAGTVTTWYFGDDKSDLKDHAWYEANSNGGTHPVARKAPNPWGLYDVYGNVSEWCLDDFRRLDDVRFGSVDPLYLESQPVLKVTRGGSCDDQSDFCMSAKPVENQCPKWLQ